MQQPLANSQQLNPSVATRWQLVLASASPRRADLLRSAGIPFIVAPAAMDEPTPTAADMAHPAQFVERLARWKADACDLGALGIEHPLVLAADTIVWHEGQILNKPLDEAEACAMLASLSGGRHQVFTGVCLRGAGRDLVEHDVTTVRFYPRSKEWIARYVATGEPMDKAGGYAAQGLGAVMIAGVDGDFTNVVGLPLGRLGRMLEEFGAPAELWWSSS